MPSSLHQLLIDLLRHAPELGPSLLRATGAVGPVESVRPLDAVLDQLERRVDLAMEVHFKELGPVAIGFEVQLTIKPEKLRTWPLYLTSLRSAACPRALLVVLTPDPRVARWAAQPIDLGPGNENFRVQVIGPEQIPRVTEIAEARRAPELALLSALAHANADGDPELVRVALLGLRSLDRARAWSYGCALLRALDPPLRGNVEVTMTDTEAASIDTEPAPNEPDIPWEIVERAIRWGEGLELERQRREAARVQGLEEGRVEGLEQGREQGREQGLEQGLEQGRLQGHREVLLRFLARAGLRPSPEEAGKIEACTELARLDRWIDQSVAARTVAEALAER